MTTPLIKVKVFPKPVLKGKMDVRFPASLSATSPITLNTAGGAYAFGLDLDSLLISLSGHFLSSTIHFADIQGNIAVSQFNNGTGASGSTFWCGDGTWKAVSGAVTSFNARTGAVTPVAGDYKYSDNTIALPAKYWSGLQHSNNVATPNTKIDIAAGVCRDSTDAQNITVAAGTIDCGTVGANGLDAGALANSTKYYTFAIVQAGGTQALLASLSPTAPTLPGSYTKFRRIGFFKTDSSAHILPFHHVNNQWWWDTSPRDVNSTTLTLNASTAVTLSVPNVLGVVALFTATGFPTTTASATTIYIYPTFLPTTAKSGGGVLEYNTSQGVAAQASTQVDSSGQININPNSANGQTVVIDLAGWIDNL